MPNTRSPLICVPDTSALIHLRDVEIAGRNARLWLWDEFEVHVGETILVEATRHADLMQGQLKRKLQRSTMSLQPHKGKMEQGFMESLGFAFGPLDDLGERDNCSVALQSVIRNKACQVIFLIDELRILRPNTGFVKSLFDCYPIGLVWNSLDFLLYLYLRHKRFLYDLAENAVRTVNARIGGQQEVTERRLSTYIRNLRCIASARDRVPELW